MSECGDIDYLHIAPFVSPHQVSYVGSLCAKSARSNEVAASRRKGKL